MVDTAPIHTRQTKLHIHAGYVVGGGWVKGWGEGGRGWGPYGPQATCFRLTGTDMQGICVEYYLLCKRAGGGGASHSAYCLAHKHGTSSPKWVHAEPLNIGYTPPNLTMPQCFVHSSFLPPPCCVTPPPQDLGQVSASELVGDLHDQGCTLQTHVMIHAQIPYIVHGKLDIFVHHRPLPPPHDVSPPKQVLGQINAAELVGYIIHDQGGYCLIHMLHMICIRRHSTAYTNRVCLMHCPPPPPHRTWVRSVPLSWWGTFMTRGATASRRV